MLPDADTTNADSLVDSGKTPPGRSVRLSRSFAFFQVALIWVVPTQVLVGAILAVGTGIEVVQGGNLSLEQALAAFEEGVRLSRRGAEILDSAESRVELLLRDDSATGARAVPFEGQGGER